MRIILFRFEKSKINLLQIDLNSNNMIFGEKECLSLESCESRGEKYKRILDELLQINARFSPDLFCYHTPQKVMGKTDEERYTNESMLHLFCFEKEISIKELYKPNVRKQLSVTDKEFKKIVEDKKNEILKEKNITKTDKILEGIIYISLIKHHL